MMDPTLIAAALCFGLAFILWGVSADAAMPTLPDYERERQRQRSRNQY